MKMKNLLIGGMSLALVACLSVSATLAYLSDFDGPKTNTFKFANGLDVTLEEDATGNSNGTASSTASGIDYTELVPGVDIAKNVDVTFTSDIDAYFFIKVESTGSGAELKIKDFALPEGWQKYNAADGSTTEKQPTDTYGEYVFTYTGTGEDIDTKIDLFSKVFVENTVASGNLKNIKISVKAIQKDGFANMKDAYAAVDYQSNT